MKIPAFNVNRVRAWLPIPPAVCRVLILVSLILISRAFTACGVCDDQGSTPPGGTNPSSSTTSTSLKPDGAAPILLFNGTGVSPNDVAAFETILKGKHVNYSKVNSSQLNEMSESQIRGYGFADFSGWKFHRHRERPDF